MNNARKIVIAGIGAFTIYEIVSFTVDTILKMIRKYINSLILKNIKQKYEIIRILGTGKTSNIYKAKRKSDNAIVAIKVLNKTNIIVLESNAFSVERDILQSIEHPNIIELYNSQEYQLYDVLELECATDGSLYTYIRNVGTLSELQTLRLITQIMSALLYLNDVPHIIHRDIKPENILVFKAPFVYQGLEQSFYYAIEREANINFKLCDFGFSGTNPCVCGTQFYTEPSVFAREANHSFNSDIWSLGIVAHYALFGTNPYYELTVKHREDAFLDNMCMEEKNWHLLGPKLKCFFSCALSYKDCRSYHNIEKLYDALLDKRNLPTF